MQAINQLIYRSQAGDQAAFGEIFEQYKNLVYKTAFLLLDDRYQAEDALQEIFVKVYGSLAKYDPARGAFSTWLYRMTVNHCLNQRRKARPAAEPGEYPGIAITPARRVEDRLAEEESIRLALQSLSGKLRVVIVLRYYHELSYAEIAQILDIPLGTVQSRLNQAMKKIQQALQAEQSRNFAQGEAPDELS